MWTDLRFEPLFTDVTILDGPQSYTLKHQTTNSNKLAPGALLRDDAPNFTGVRSA
jgi:hypothetical protein